MLVIDSNVWAYFLDSTLPEHERVKEAMRRYLEEEEVLMTTVVQLEIVHYLVKRLGPVLGGEKLDVFLNYPFTLDVLDYDLVLKAGQVLRRYSHMGIGARDASIIASMRRNGVTRLVTHDSALKRIEEIETIDPAG